MFRVGDVVIINQESNCHKFSLGVKVKVITDPRMFGNQIFFGVSDGNRAAIVSDSEIKAYWEV